MNEGKYFLESLFETCWMEDLMKKKRERMNGELAPVKE